MLPTGVPAFTRGTSRRILIVDHDRPSELQTLHDSTSPVGIAVLFFDSWADDRIYLAGGTVSGENSNYAVRTSLIDVRIIICENLLVDNLDLTDDTGENLLGSACLQFKAFPQT